MLKNVLNYGLIIMRLQLMKKEHVYLKILVAIMQYINYRWKKLVCSHVLL